MVFVKVTTIGGGPGGLYASLLLKKTHPDWDVTVYERNPPDVTYGWGIVFPNRALSNLEAADPESHRAITEEFTRWADFEIYYDGTRYACGGNAFASMMRTELLRVLQGRAREVGVDLQFDQPVEDPAAHADDADLLIGADGIHSPTRETWPDAFGVQSIEGTTRFSWFGTDADFDALAHIFETTDDGIFCAHTYPGPTSTFIVDCDHETWATSGLAGMDESEYLASLEEVFADHLDGHSLKSEIDTWRTFTTIWNDTWHHDNVVLLGDAAHTAHYSIGSGTTLAMEDAIGLMNAVDVNGDDVAAALADYEADRRPFVEELQRAGERSRMHFEAIRRFFSLPERQRAVHHLTRSGRVSYESLLRRDPEFMATFDQWFAGQARDIDPDTLESVEPPCRQPLSIGGVTLDNRLVAAAEPTFSSRQGQPTTAQSDALVSRAAAGVGLVLTEPLAVTSRGRPTPGSAGLYTNDHTRAWRDTVEAIHDRGVLAGVHLTHAGPGAGASPRGFSIDRPSGNQWRPLAASPVTYGEGRTPEPVTASDIEDLIETFVTATERAGSAGFDYLQLHLGHGNLFASFLSPLTNRREDAYGGSLEHRIRFPLAVVEAVRATWDGPLGATAMAADWVPNGFDLDDAFVLAGTLAETGVDLVAPIGGGTVATERAPNLEDPRWYSDQIRNEVGIQTVATSHATTPDEVNTLVGTGRADLVTYYGQWPE